MSTSIQRRAARVAVLAALLALALWAANVFGSNLAPKTQAWLLGTVTVVFFLSEVFFWKSIDKVTELPQSDALTTREAGELTSRVQALKRSLVNRWFLLMVLKAAAGACTAWLANQTTAGLPEQVCWLSGVGVLALSFPIALSLFRVWRLADEIQAKQRLEARQKKDQKASLAQLADAPAEALKADKQLEGYTKVVGKAKRASTQ